jgi:hypothetical protein
VTAVDEDLSLDWVTYTDRPGDEPCDGAYSKPCPLEAVARSVWAKTCPHVVEVVLHCAGHRDLALEVAAMSVACRHCRVPALMIRMEPIR